MDLEGEEMTLEQLHRELDLKKRTLANDKIALGLKREEDLSKVAQGGTPPSFTAKKAKQIGAKKTATARPKATPGPKPKQKQASKRSMEEEDDEYRGPTVSKKTSPNGMRDDLTLREPVIKVDEDEKESTGGTILPRAS